ncbi:MAG: YhjD/YihY/BrkB family envelope integrity protein [Acidobacteriota bacterium]|nr:YihY/virulence factor BrkB family protein [Blastocatellia bacterium]MDW8239886.1 YhjD/YihY/BrkB family envelope integrity protein [Acidobacteriota bacterium]
MKHVNRWRHAIRCTVIRLIRHVLTGAFLATGLWMLTTLGFSAYANNFGKRDVLYGSRGAGIVLLIGGYISSLVVFIGGEFNAASETNVNDAAWTLIEHACCRYSLDGFDAR